MPTRDRAFFFFFLFLSLFPFDSTHSALSLIFDHLPVVCTRIGACSMPQRAKFCSRVKHIPRKYTHAMTAHDERTNIHHTATNSELCLFKHAESQAA